MVCLASSFCEGVGEAWVNFCSIGDARCNGYCFGSSHVLRKVSKTTCLTHPVLSMTTSQPFSLRQRFPRLIWDSWRSDECILDSKSPLQRNAINICRLEARLELILYLAVHHGLNLSTLEEQVLCGEMSPQRNQTIWDCRIPKPYPPFIVTAELKKPQLSYFTSINNSTSNLTPTHHPDLKRHAAI
jgi:hypothetical protein